MNCNCYFCGTETIRRQWLYPAHWGTEKALRHVCLRCAILHFWRTMLKPVRVRSSNVWCW